MKKGLFIIAVSLLLQNSNAQTLEWVKQIGNVETDRALAIMVDNAGNSYTTGVYDGTVDFDPGPDTLLYTAIGTGEAFVTKLDAAGNFVKTINWGYGSGGHIVLGGALHAHPSSGNLYIGGYFTGSNIDFDPSDTVAYKISATGGENAYLLKLDAAGKFMWVKKWLYNKEVSEGDGPGWTFDAASNIYSTGRFAGNNDFDPGDSVHILPGKWYDGYISKLDSNGVFLWAKHFPTNDSTTSYVHPRSISLDGSGNIFIAGVFNGTVDLNPDTTVAFNLTAVVEMGFVAKYDASGNFLWAKAVGNDDNPLQEYDETNAVIANTAGDAYITGSFMGTVSFGSTTLTSAGANDIYIAKLDATGNYLWVKQIGTFYSSEAGDRLTLDNDGNLYITGIYRGTADFNPGPGASYLTTNGSVDVFVLKLTPSGDFVWAKGYGGAVHDVTIASIVVKGNDVYTAGRFYVTVNFDPNGYYPLTCLDAGGVESDVFIHKMNQVTTGVFDLAENLQMTVYPNPATGSFFIMLDTERREAEATLCDIQGRKVRELYLNQPLTEVDVTGLQKGLYFIKAQSSNSNTVQKLIVE